MYERRTSHLCRLRPGLCHRRVRRLQLGRGEPRLAPRIGRTLRHKGIVKGIEYRRGGPSNWKTVRTYLHMYVYIYMYICIYRYRFAAWRRASAAPCVTDSNSHVYVYIYIYIYMYVYNIYVCMYVYTYRVNPSSLAAASPAWRRASAAPCVIEWTSFTWGVG